MADINNMVLTEKGEVLYAKGQAGATIHFTKMMVGAGDIGSVDPQTLTSLINGKFNIGIQSKSVNTAQKVALISGTFTNENITEAIYICEIGLFAEDPDEGEILYSYASAGAKGDYMSPASNGPYSWNYQVYAAIGNAPNITVTLSNLQYDTSVINSNTTLVIIKGDNQKAINQSIDNKFKIYTTTNSGNTYTITSSDIDTLEDGYPITVRFNEDSTGDISLIVNNSNAHDVVDYFNNKISNVRDGLVAKLVFDANNSNFQLLGKGGEGNLTSDKLLIGYYGTGNDGVVHGNVANNGTLNASLNAGESYSIPNGFATGGTIAANSLANQTQATATAADVVNGKTAWVDGSEITGNASIESLGGKQYTTSTINHTSGAIDTVNLPFTPSIVKLYGVASGATYAWTSGTVPGFTNIHSGAPTYDNTVTIVGNVLTIPSTWVTTAIYYYAWE